MPQSGKLSLETKPEVEFADFGNVHSDWMYVSVNDGVVDGSVGAWLSRDYIYAERGPEFAAEE